MLLSFFVRARAKAVRKKKVTKPASAFSRHLSAQAEVLQAGINHALLYFELNLFRKAKKAKPVQKQNSGLAFF
jgi:hypothetical protein